MRTKDGSRTRATPGAKLLASLGAAAWTAALCLLPARPGAAEGSSPTVEETRAALDRWVETRRVISKEQSEWRLGKEMLGQRVEVLQGEIASLRAKIGETEGSIADADGKRAALLEQNERLAQGSNALRATVGALETRTRALLARLPGPLREHVAPLSQRLPDDPEQSKLTLSERFQNVVGVLNEIDKFHREVRLTSEVRTLRDGSSAEVTALYLGVGQGYYVTGDGKSAGVGRSTQDGWEWTPADEAAPAIAAAVAILGSEQVASFVRVPVRVE